MKTVISVISLCVFMSACFAGNEPQSPASLSQLVRYSTLIVAGTVVSLSVVNAHDLAPVTPEPQTLKEGLRFMLKLKVNETLEGPDKTGELVKVLVGAPQADTKFFSDTFKDKSLIFFVTQDREIAASKNYFFAIHGAMDCWGPLAIKPHVVELIHELAKFTNH